MEPRRKIGSALFLFFLLFSFVHAVAQDFKSSEAKIAEYKRWLDRVGAKGSRLWLRVESDHRPHRLFVGDGFERVDFAEKERFVEIFSSFLAGHPEKFMLIDIYDGKTGQPVGEFGWGGFKLY